MTEPLDKSALDLIDAMVHTRDVGKAAMKCGISRYRAVAMLRIPHIKDELAKRQGIEGAEVAKIVARKRVVNIEALDKNLMQVVKISSATLKETPSLAASKVKAIELGYQRVGMMIDGNFIPDESSVNAGQQGQTDGPRIFRATNTKMLMHSIETRETHQVVTVSHEHHSSSPPTIDADPSSSPFNY